MTLASEACCDFQFILLVQLGIKKSLGLEDRRPLLSLPFSGTIPCVYMVNSVKDIQWISASLLNHWLIGLV